MPNPGVDNDGVNCEKVQRGLREGHELTRLELAHVDECDTCADASMDAWLTAGLDAKPEVVIPADFAARVAAMAPARAEKRQMARTPRHWKYPWGVISAMAVVTVLLVVCFAGPLQLSYWVETTFVLLVATEIAGLALWLGPRWLGR